MAEDTTRAIRIHQPGGPEKMVLEPIPIAVPGEGEAQLQQTAIGLNFIDIYFRRGTYPVASLPFTPGSAAAGIVTAIGPGVHEVKVGDRVAYATAPIGAYAERRTLPARFLVPIPAAISDEAAAATLLQGMTVSYLLRQTFRVEAGMSILFHAAAGGVGLIACQWAKHLGVNLIGSVSTNEKAALAKAHGAAETIMLDDDWPARVRAITGGGVPVVYDSIGKTSFFGSLDCLRPRGLLALFGGASGPVPPLDLIELSRRGSLYVTRPSLFDYAKERQDLLDHAAEFFGLVADGVIKLNIHQCFALKDAGDAHRALEARTTTGSTVLMV